MTLPFETEAALRIPARRLEIPAWLPVVGFAVVIAALLITGRAGPVKLLFPLGGLAVGIFLFLKGPAPYIAYGWLLWQVAPGIRRIVDYQLGGWDPQNPMSLTPFLVSSLGLVGVLRRLPELRHYRLAPWLVAIVCIGYGYFSGILQLGVMPATHALVSWLVPLGFGLYCAVEWRRYPELRSAFRFAFLLGTGILGCYGIFQFIDPPMWDRHWMISSGMYSVGRAFPYEVRVFSLVNAPLPFATILVAGLMIALSTRGVGRILLLVAGTMALLLSLVRSVWLAGLLGVLVYVASVPLRTTRKVIAPLLVTAAAILAAPLLAPPEISQPTMRIVQDRFLTLSSIQSDVSFRDRTSFLSRISNVVLESPAGRGLGSTGVSSTLDESGEGIRDFDNGVFAALYSLGWMGGAGILLSVLTAIALTFKRREPGDDLLAKAARGVAVTSIALSLGGNVLEGVSGAVLWGFLGVLTASHRYHEATRIDGSSW